MAHKKAAGSTTNGRDSNPNMYGVKKFGGEQVIAGNIIIRQAGNKFHAGPGVKQGKDCTLFATIDGAIKFSYYNKTKKIVSVVQG